MQKIFVHHPILKEVGLTIDILESTIAHTHYIIDEIDGQLLTVKVNRLAHLIELANLSSMMGNLLGAGIENFSNGQFQRNGPHKFPDLLAQHVNAKDVEIKVSLENNTPKGHLAKKGYYLTFRYVLIHHEKGFKHKERGDIPRIWEIRLGYLTEVHFNLSNTKGDSGKTAVINKTGMEALKILYVNLDYCPYTKRSPTYKKYQSMFH